MTNVISTLNPKGGSDNSFGTGSGSGSGSDSGSSSSEDDN